MYEEYKDRVAFFIVYLREAHTEDGRQAKANEQDGLIFYQPESLEERVEIAEEMCSTLDLKIPCLIDGIDNRVGTDYTGMPDRLYLVGLDGKVAFKGEKGPKGFKPELLREFLDLYLLTLEAVGDEVRPAGRRR
jgi:hypothetical protein